MGLFCAVFPGGEQATGQTSALASEELTLEQFRHRVETHLAATARSGGRSREKPPPADLRAANEVFLQLLLIQARGAAARQSQDRLSGWSQAIQSRFEMQTASALDRDVVLFSLARMAAEAARIEAELKQVTQRANSLIDRPATAPLTALLPVSEGDADGMERRQKDLLEQGQELIAKMYKSYQFGGISVTSLMEYEKELYETEVEYRQGVARAAVRAAEEASGD
jgi:hypothetical protein